MANNIVLLLIRLVIHAVVRQNFIFQIINIPAKIYNIIITPLYLQQHTSLVLKYIVLIRYLIRRVILEISISVDAVKPQSMR